VVLICFSAQMVVLRAGGGTHIAMGSSVDGSRVKRSLFSVLYFTLFLSIWSTAERCRLSTHGSEGCCGVEKEQAGYLILSGMELTYAYASDRSRTINTLGNHNRNESLWSSPIRYMFLMVLI
jgi:hypothetical protein